MIEKMYERTNAWYPVSRGLSMPVRSTAGSAVSGR